MTPRRLRIVVASLLSAAIQTMTACEDYEAAPVVTLVGAEDGFLDDPRAPLVVDFGIPVEEDSVRVSVVSNVEHDEGRLADEDDDPGTSLTVYLSHQPGEVDQNAETAFDATGRFMTLTPKASLDVGSALALLVESGVRSKSGRTMTYRHKTDFSYAVHCDDKTAKNFVEGTYFVLFAVEKPVGTRLQLFGKIKVDQDDGRLVGQFTRATRNLQQQCPTPCSQAESCRLLPVPECVAPSTAAASLDEYPDFVPNPDPNAGGFSVAIRGCAVDEGAASNIATAPATLNMNNIVIAGLTMNAKFTSDDAGVVQGSGGLIAEAVSIGSSAPAAGRGTMTALRIPDDRVPLGIPDAPAFIADAADGGADASR